MDIIKVAGEILTIVVNSEPNLWIRRDELGRQHIINMLVKIRHGIVDGEKAHHWLGWVQCAVVSSGVATFEEMKLMNSPKPKIIGYRNCNDSKVYQAIQWDKSIKHPNVFQDYISSHGGDINIDDYYLKTTQRYKRIIPGDWIVTLHNETGGVVLVTKEAFSHCYTPVYE